MRDKDIVLTKVLTALVPVPTVNCKRVTSSCVNKIKVLIADDSALMRSAIRRALEEEARIQLVGEAETLPEMMKKIATFKPDVLLFDLHLADERNFDLKLVKSQLGSVKRAVAISFSNDQEALALSKKCGAQCLLDKMNLYYQLIPSILRSVRSNSAQRLD
jgi:DNA-binding NarL/FixJ family response regulator